MEQQVIKFYQTGTFTVGNRLLAENERSVQANLTRTNSLNSGHRACQGCGEALGARYAIDAAMRATNNQLIAVNATGCLEVFVYGHQWGPGPARVACPPMRVALHSQRTSARPAGLGFPAFQALESLLDRAFGSANYPLRHLGALSFLFRQ